MHVTLVTAFPEFFRDFLTTSIVGRAVRKGLIQVDWVDLRGFGRGGYRQIDDYAFGSGGMVLAAPQLRDATEEARRRSDERAFVVYPSPQGAPLTQETVETLSRQGHVILLCGHYEGVDERFVQREIDLEVSFGDCVLTGGEIPAMAIVDAMSRLVPGVVGRGEAVAEDSFYRGMLDHPHYTRPALWEGMAVPEALMSGDEAGITAWRRAEAARRTLARRPDLLARAAIGDYLPGKRAAFQGAAREDAAALSALSRAYGLGRPLVILASPEERRAFGGEGLNPAPRVLGSAARAIQEAGRQEPPLVVVVLPEPEGGWLHSLEVKRRCLERQGPVLFLFTDAAPNVPEGVEALCTSLYLERDPLPLAERAAIALDRFLGKR